MEQDLKTRIILILSILSLIFFIVIMRSCGDVKKYREAKDKETATRFELEDKINKLMQAKTVIEGNLNNLTQELNEEKAAHQATENALTQEQLVSQSLKDELQKVTKLKEKLEEDLKEALVADQSAKAKMR